MPCRWCSATARSARGATRWRASKRSSAIGFRADDPADDRDAEDHEHRELHQPEKEPDDRGDEPHDGQYDRDGNERVPPERGCRALRRFGHALESRTAAAEPVAGPGRRAAGMSG